MSPLPPEGRSAGRDKAYAEALVGDLQRLREDFPPLAQAARHTLWRARLLEDIGITLGDAPLGEEACAQIVRSLWEGIPVQEAAGPDLLNRVRTLAGMEDPAFWDMTYRADQLRACGNGVVPLQAAVALVLLARRAGLVE